MCLWLILLGSVCSYSVLAQTNPSFQKLSIVILHEVEQDDVPALMADELRNLENSFPQIGLNDHYVTMERENINRTLNNLCQVLGGGVHAVLDLTWYRSDEVDELFAAANVARFLLDISIKPFVVAMSTYLQARDAYDAIFIFQNEREMDAGLYHLMIEGKLRVITFNGLGAQTAQQIQRLRPIPTYTAVLASGPAMIDIIDVASRHKLLERPDTWNVLFLDFDHEHFMDHLKTPTVSTIVPDHSMCCRFIRKPQDSPTCKCGNDITIPAVILHEFVTILVTSIVQTGNPVTTYSCAQSQEDTTLDEAPSKFRQIVEDSVRSSLLLLFDGDSISYRINMTVFKEDPDQADGRSTEVAQLDNFELTPLIPTAIQRSRNFYRIGITDAIPWTYARRDPMTGEAILDAEGKPVWEGYCIDFIAKIAEIMDFDYELVTPKHGTFGDRKADNTWDGLVGDLMVGETDIAVAALKMTAEREEVIDFIPPYFEQTGILIAIRNPVRQTSLFKFMTVLRLEVWLSIVAALFATAIMIWLLDKYSPYSARNNKSAYPYPCRDFSLKESFWFALTSFTPQGGGEAPKSLSGRTMVSAYWLFVVLMLATFTANLAAFLTVERMQTPVQSLDQLARQSRINYTVVKGSDTHQYFENMKFAEDTLYRVWKEITLNSTNDQARYRVWEYPIREQYGQILMAIEAAEPVLSADDGFRKVNEHENADYAFIHDSAEIKYEISRNCNLTEVGEVFAEQPYAIGIQQGSNLQDDLTRTVLRLQRERFFDELTAKFWNHSAKGQCVNTDDSEGITLESLGGVFIATLFGLALSMVTLVGEVLYYRRKEHRQTGDVVQIVKPAAPRNAFGDEPPPPFPTGDDAPQVTIGNEFVPSSEKRPAYISIFPRRSIHSSGSVTDPNKVD